MSTATCVLWSPGYFFSLESSSQIFYFILELESSVLLFLLPVCLLHCYQIDLPKSYLTPEGWLAQAHAVVPQCPLQKPKLYALFPSELPFLSHPSPSFQSRTFNFPSGLTEQPLAPHRQNSAIVIRWGHKAPRRRGLAFRSEDSGSNLGWSWA